MKPNFSNKISKRVLWRLFAAVISFVAFPLYIFLPSYYHSKETAVSFPDGDVSKFPVEVVRGAVSWGDRRRKAVFIKYSTGKRELIRCAEWSSNPAGCFFDVWRALPADLEIKFALNPDTQARHYILSVTDMRGNVLISQDERIKLYESARSHYRSYDPWKDLYSTIPLMIIFCPIMWFAMVLPPRGVNVNRKDRG